MNQEPLLHETPIKRAAITLKGRSDAVIRLLAGEDPAAIGDELHVPARQIEGWAKEFCRAGETRLRQLPDNWLERWFAVAEKLVPLATLISVLLAVTLFVQGQRKQAMQNARAAATEREDRVRDAYSSLDDRYLDYCKVCLDHPTLDVFDTPLHRDHSPTADQLRQEKIVLSMLQSIMERAYLMYSTPDDSFEQKQWAAWSNYVQMWSTRDNFRDEWKESRDQFDATFSAYVDGLIHSTSASTRP